MTPESTPLQDRIDWKRFFSYKRIVQNIPFILFLSLMAVLYIFNGHYADKLARKIESKEKRVRELEYEYKTLKSEVIFRSKPSELMKAVEPMGLKEWKSPPVLLVDSSALP